VDEVEAARGEVAGGQIGLDDDQALGLERLQEARVRVQGRDRAVGTDALGQRDGEAAGALARVEAFPAGGESEPLAQREGALVVEGGEAVEPVALRVPGGVEGVSGGEGRSHTA
jgi:hypothetical protein